LIPRGNWARFTILVYVGVSSLATLLVSAIGDGVARYAGIGTLMGGVVVVLFVVDQWAWKAKGIRTLLRKPNLNGTWTVEVRWKAADGEDAAKTAYLVIHQTYSEVAVEVLTDQARSCSDAASVTKRGPRWVLAYVYRAESEAIIDVIRPTVLRTVQ
jgi:hypothetical protein